jgi:hypothetical protein
VLGGRTTNAFVSKINASGTALAYSTYLGGSGFDGDYGQGIAVDATGSVYVVGRTSSPDFPVVNALQPTYGGSFDAFVTKINSTGSALVYSTYLGGDAQDLGQSIAVDGVGHAFVTGQTESADFPLTTGAFQTSCNGGNCERGVAFVSELSQSGSALVYSTYLGGSGGDLGLAVAVDSAGAAYVTGQTTSLDFPTLHPLQQVFGGGHDAFVTKINSSGSELIYSTYLGGSNLDFGQGIAVDSAGNAYVTGMTESTDFPVSNAWQPSLNGVSDAFVAKLNASGSAFIYSTYLGGSAQDFGQAIAVDTAGDAYVTGETTSKDFPVTSGAVQAGCNPGAICANNGDAFVSKIDPSGTALTYSTFLGGKKLESGQGIAVDSLNNVYVAGQTYSSNFPTTSNALQPHYSLKGDAFVAKIQILPATTTTLSSSPNPSTVGEGVTFTAVVSSSAGQPPNGESVSFMSGKKLLGTGTLSSGSASITLSTLKKGTTAVTAVYPGDSSFAGSTSNTVQQVVQKSKQ